MNINSLVRKLRIQGIVEQTVRCGLDGRCRQFTLPVLRNFVQEHFTNDLIMCPELVDELRTMRRNGRVLFTKPDHYREHATGFIGIEPDEWFYGVNFNIVLR
jgi:hypothetical protein